MIKAINIQTGTTFEIISITNKTFKGKVIKDPINLWKHGDICKNLSTEFHHILITDWDEYRMMKEFIQFFKKWNVQKK
jgi:hypothetical protein